MENIEYVIVGGPQHGQISRRAWKTDASTPLAEPACDGLLCRAAARRHALPAAAPQGHRRAISDHAGRLI
jgi:hypothetical protein